MLLTHALKTHKNRLSVANQNSLENIQLIKIIRKSYLIYCENQHQDKSQGQGPMTGGKDGIKEETKK
jgi:hypothetical protein